MILLRLLLFINLLLIGRFIETSSSQNQENKNINLQLQISTIQSTIKQIILNKQQQSQQQQSQQRLNPNSQQPTQQQSQEHSQTSHYHSPNELQFWLNALLAAVLTCLGGFCSGMTIGLMSIETMQLEIMSISHDQKQKKIGNRILNVVNNHHLFLVTLLLVNAMALQSLPLVVHSLMPDWMAILFSTFIVLLIAQIIPQSICTGSNKITLAYYACPIISVMMKILWIIVYPIAKGLDSLLGIHGHQRIQHKDFANFLSGDVNNSHIQKILKQTQILLLTEILQLRCQRVTNIMVPLKDVYMLNVNEILTRNKIIEINKTDYSYIFTYETFRQNIVGSIKVKQFAMKYLSQFEQNYENINITTIMKDHEIMTVYSDTNLLEIFLLFQSKSMRIALVCDDKKKILPNMQSIMYSKNDMIMRQKNARIIGVIFLYQIFEEIANYNNNNKAIIEATKITKQNQLNSNNNKNMTQMQQIKQPLIN